MASQCQLSKCIGVYGIIMTEVIGIKFEENGMVEYVIPDRHYTKDDFVVVLEKRTSVWLRWSWRILIFLRSVYLMI